MGLLEDGTLVVHLRCHRSPGHQRQEAGEEVVPAIVLTAYRRSRIVAVSGYLSVSRMKTLNFPSLPTALLALILRTKLYVNIISERCSLVSFLDSPLRKKLKNQPNTFSEVPAH